MSVSEGVLLKSEDNGTFDIIKSDDLVIGGYASIEIVDKQNDLVTLDALETAVTKYMNEKKYRNVMSNHSNVQVGEVIPKYRDKHGFLHKTQVDDVGFYVVIKLRDDIEKAKEIARGIRKGTLRSFSIGGQALSKRKKSNDELGQYNEIDKLELHEVTICEKGINPEAKFDILKQERGDEMTERLEKALEELNELMGQVNELRKEEGEYSEPAEEETKEEDFDLESMDAQEEESEETPDDLEYADFDDSEEEEKMRTGPEGPVEHGFGEDLAAGKKHSQMGQLGQVTKEWKNDEFATLNLSADNVEKAYEAYKAEQLEKIAYDSLKDTFATRFKEETSVRKEDIARREYNAKSEVETLREEFATLRKSLSEQTETIAKAQEIEVPAFDVAEMSWGDIHNLVSEYER